MYWINTTKHEEPDICRPKRDYYGEYICEFCEKAEHCILWQDKLRDAEAV